MKNRKRLKPLFLLALTAVLPALWYFMPPPLDKISEAGWVGVQLNAEMAEGTELHNLECSEEESAALLAAVQELRLRPEFMLSLTGFPSIRRYPNALIFIETDNGSSIRIQYHIAYESGRDGLYVKLSNRHFGRSVFRAQNPDAFLRLAEQIAADHGVTGTLCKN